MTARALFVEGVGASADAESIAPLSIAPVGTPLDVIGADEFCGAELPEIDWLVPRFIPRGGFAILYGAPKAGKTTFLYHMAAALASGGNFLGWQHSAQRVLLLDLEQPIRITQRALHLAGANETKNLLVYRGAPPAIGDVLATVRTHGISLIAVDSLSRWLELENENDNSEINRRLAPILRACQTQDVSLAVIHHDRKSEGDNGRNMRGGGAYLATCDSAIELRRVSGDDADARRQIRFTSRIQQPSIVVKLEAGHYVEEAAPSIQREARVRDILTGRELTSAELADALGEKERTIRDWLEPLTRRGIVVMTGGGKRGDPFRYTVRDYSGDGAAGLSRNTGNAEP